MCAMLSLAYEPMDKSAGAAPEDKKKANDRRSLSTLKSGHAIY